MLTKVSIIAGVNAAQRLGTRTYKANTDLERLVAYGVTPKIAEITNAQTTSWVDLSTEEIMAAYRTPSVSGDNEHDKDISAIVESVSKGLSGVVDLVSNVINPICREVKDHISSLEKEELSEILRTPTVSTYWELSLAEVPLLEDLLESQQIGAVDKEITLPDQILSKFKRFSSMTMLERLAIIASGNDVIDAFSKKVLMEAKNSEYFELGYNYDSNEVAHYINWMFANRLLKNIPEGLNMGLAEYEAAVSKARNVYARLLKLEMERSARNAQTGGLFVYAPSRTLTNNYNVYVYGEAYLNWTKAGGSPEALYGIIVLGLAGKKAKELTDFDTYLKAYHSYQTRQQSLYATKFVDLVIRGCRSRMVDLVIKYHPDLVTTKVSERLNKVINRRRDATPENLDYWLRSTLVKAFYPSSNAMLFIDELMEQQKLKPDAEMKELAEIARAYFIADYLAEFIIP